MINCSELPTSLTITTKNRNDDGTVWYDTGVYTQSRPLDPNAARPDKQYIIYNPPRPIRRTWFEPYTNADGKNESSSLVPHFTVYPTHGKDTKSL